MNQSRASSVIAAIILVAPIFVNAASSEREQQQFLTVVERVRKEGNDAVMVAGRARYLDLDRGLPLKRMDFGTSDAADGLAHTFEVVLDSAATDSVVAVVLRAGRLKPDGVSEGFDFRLSAGGAVTRIARTRSEFKDGKAVPGSGKADILPLDDKAAKRKLQHELDFWLKGKYRKKK